MKNTMRLVSFCIAVILVMFSQMGSVFAQSTQLTGKEFIGDREEITSMRTVNSQTYKLANGNFQTDIYGADIYFEKDNKLMTIDNSIVRSNDSNYVYQNASNKYTASFRNITSSTSSVNIAYERYEFYMTPIFHLTNKTKDLSNKMVDDWNIRPTLAKEQKTDMILEKNSMNTTSSLCEFEQTLIEDDRTVWYNDVYPDVDFVYTALHDGLKEDIIIRSGEAPSVYSFELDTKGLTPIIEEGILYLVDTEDGRTVFEMLEPFMEDAKGASSGKLKWLIDTKGSKSTLTIYASKEFMLSDDTVYPIRLDPTFVTKGTNYTSDTYISSKNSTINYVTNQYLRTGKDEPYGIRRSYIRFKLPSGYKANGITAATLQLTLHSKGSSAINPRVYVSNGYWKSNQIVYDAKTNSTKKNISGYTGTAISPTVSGNTYSFNVLTAVKNCYNQKNSNYGFVIKDTNESNLNVWGTFYSSDSSSTYIPKLSITYGTITPTTHYYSGKWPNAKLGDLQGYSDDNSSYIKNAFFNWTGIQDNVGMTSLSYSVSNKPHADIRILNDSSSSMPKSYFAATSNYDSSSKIAWSGTWEYSIIKINKRSDSIFTPLHSDLKEEIITHEIGHALGLTHYDQDSEPTTCIMQQYSRYCYPKPTSHDKNNIKAKY